MMMSCFGTKHNCKSHYTITVLTVYTIINVISDRSHFIHNLLEIFIIIIGKSITIIS